MQRFIFILAVLNMLNSFAQDSTMKELRSLFYKATLKESYIQKVNVYMSEAEERDAFDSYRSMLLFMKAKYAINPYTKLSHFKKGRKKMEAAVKLYPDDIETHFLRLAIQTKLPSFLGYNEAKETDKAFIIQHFKEITDKDLKARILLFFKENELLNQQEYQQLWS
ncbi:MAG: hypothetical protein N4A35_10365 [Flavobacteriales bacterium]|jgi:hypothetical protein|nr:hypothetical protein [Flavobacteriales bacterium]